jgi:hypothetical protein
MTISPMSSTGGGGGGGGGGAGFTGFFTVVAAGFGFGFELLAAGFFVVVAGLVAGLVGVVVCAIETGASRHAATRAAAMFKARGYEASMRGFYACARLHRVEMPVFDRCTFAGQLALVEICDVAVGCVA